MNLQQIRKTELSPTRAVTASNVWLPKAGPAAAAHRPVCSAHYGWLTLIRLTRLYMDGQHVLKTQALILAEQAAAHPTRSVLKATLVFSISCGRAYAPEQCHWSQWLDDRADIDGGDGGLCVLRAWRVRMRAAARYQLFMRTWPR